MRNIKFRGKRFDTKEWIYGDLLDNSVISSGGIDVDNEYISIDEWCSIIPSTIGQYTGLKDCNGIEIYEGDILGGIIGGCVVWIAKEARFGIDILGEIHECKFEEFEQCDFEVIGNIYEAGELNDNENANLLEARDDV